VDNLLIFSGKSNLELSKNICKYLGKPLGDGMVTHFPDGESMVKVKDDIRGKDCFIIQSTCPPVNENIMDLLIYIDCLKRASANSITVVIPYFGYARQDRKSEGRTPITSKMVADLITTVGAHRVLTIDLHAKQIEGFFNIPVDHLSACPVLVRFLKDKKIENAMVLSPDVGNMKVANLYAKELNLDLAVVDKRRVSGEEAVAQKIVGEVENKNIIMFDDMISTAGTISSAAKIAKDHGAKHIYVAATHGLFSGPARERILGGIFEEIYITDTIPLNKNIRELIQYYDPGSANYPKIEVISVANLLGEAILRIYQKRSVSILLKSDYESDII
jgi:ribose-phosphate pyrophosphokinase